jgi:hypothetical protein
VTPVGPDAGDAIPPPTSDTPTSDTPTSDTPTSDTPTSDTANTHQATPTAAPDTSRGGGYGNIYTPHAGSMIIQVQRESGLQSRTIVLTGRQIRLLRFIMSRSGKLLAAAAVAIAVLLIVEAARVPTLIYRISRMEHTAQRLDTLERSLSELQKRYDQVRTMMGGDAAAGADHAVAGTVGFAPAPSVQTRAPANAAKSATPSAASRTTPDAAASDVTASPSSATGDQSPDSAAAALPAAHPRKARHTPPTPTTVVVPPPPDSGATPSPEAEPQ